MRPAAPARSCRSTSDRRAARRPSWFQRFHFPGPGDPGQLGTSVGTPPMLCAAIDIGSNTTRVLVAEPVEGQLKKVMEQRAYTQIGKSLGKDGAIDAEKIAEVAEVVATQMRLAE